MANTNFSLIFDIANLMGVNIIESPLMEPEPKLKLGAAAPVSAKFREEFDQYLLDMFGRKAPQIVTTPLGIFAGPSVVAALRRMT